MQSSLRNSVILVDAEIMNEAGRLARSLALTGCCYSSSRSSKIKYAMITELLLPTAAVKFSCDGLFFHLSF